MADAPLRIGILGAARIAPMALVRPARSVPEARVEAVAARDPERARRFAAKHGIARAHDSYDALLADPALDAIYNPLPNGLHCAWTIRALEAGKDVLCEKPIAANADEAAQMAEAARRTGRKLVEAFHWRYHPLAARMLEVLASGELGAVRDVETRFCIPLPMPNDIRYRIELAGGATMDTGCYAIHALRTLAGAEPEVVSARARLLRPEIDRAMAAEMRFADGRTGRMSCALLSARLFAISATVRGDRGEMRVFNFVAPQFYHRLTVRTPTGTRRERVAGDASYVHQLRAFVDHVRRDAPVPTGPEDAIANMRVIDAVYDRAGLRRRGA
ncbi:MAG TPA: Gfo/Idh/MocA family oxidoreductase [Candidatus Binatia bacterium]|nr:Gfo/Idh/MocA family oxidoreductase [Candidatus Binatia bacterium]